MAFEKNFTRSIKSDPGLAIDPQQIDGPLTLARNFNTTFGDPGDGSGLPDLVIPGDVIRDKTVYDFVGDWDESRTGDNNILSQLDTGRSQDVSDGVITFAFYSHVTTVGRINNPHFYGEGQGYAPFTAAQRAAARVAVNNWDDLIAPSIVEVRPGPGSSTWAQNTVDIWLANTTTGPTQAWAYFPGGSRIAGDVWIADPRVNGSNGQLDPGFYGLQTLNHELGHSLGLSHPGNYDFGDDNDGDGQPDPITYEGDAFYFQDNHQYTIMSYFNAWEAGNNQVDWNVMRIIYPSTPMVDDVRAIQAKYGADMTTRTGDSTYGFNATADVTNEAMRFHSGEVITVFTIWDANGNDTLDLSGYYTGSVIDLREGGFSSAGGFGAYNSALADTDASLMTKDDYLAFVNANNAAAGLPARSGTLYDFYFTGVAGVNEGVAWLDTMGRDTLMENNIGIAYGAIIENAIGGHGNDRINGNQANNMFTGGDGADTFIFARYGATDTSIDTITDFVSGVDKIDLSEFGGLTEADVLFDAATDELKVDTNQDGSYDMTIIVHGTDVAATDFIFG
jgi:Ca2+-binding RTX toxin-like protein